MSSHMSVNVSCRLLKVPFLLFVKLASLGNFGLDQRLQLLVSWRDKKGCDPNPFKSALLPLKQQGDG